MKKKRSTLAKTEALSSSTMEMNIKMMARKEKFRKEREAFVQGELGRWVTW